MEQAEFEKAMQMFPEIAALLGCDWGKLVMLHPEEEPCPHQAVQRVALYIGPNPLLIQVCEKHDAMVREYTNPHVGSDSG